MPGSSESSHPHKLVGKFTHPRSAPGRNKREPPGDVLEKVGEKVEEWNVPEVSLNELWGVDEIAGACNGSKRYLVGLLGGWGDVPAITTLGGGDFEVKKERGKGFKVVWKKYQKKEAPKEEPWGQKMEQRPEAAGGW
jgi:hypothetical protein